VISKEEAQQHADELQALCYLEVSAKTGKNVEQILHKIAEAAEIGQVVATNVGKQLEQAAAKSSCC
jgi:translation initiation factor IF-2